MPRFVILRHQCPPDYQRESHWDFMLEAEDHLRTWALTELPERVGAVRETSAEVAVEAEQLADHRLAYLDYEGEISGGRGTVSRWDQGTFQLLSETEKQLVLQLRGEKLSGRVTLTQSENTSNAWSLVFKHDA